MRDMPVSSAGPHAPALCGSYFGLVLLIGAWWGLDRLGGGATGAEAGPRPGRRHRHSDHAGDLGRAAGAGAAAVQQGRLRLPRPGRDGARARGRVRRRSRPAPGPTRRRCRADVARHPGTLRVGVPGSCGTPGAGRAAGDAVARAGRGGDDGRPPAGAGPAVRLRSGRRALARRSQPAGAPASGGRCAQRRGDARAARRGTAGGVERVPAGQPGCARHSAVHGRPAHCRRSGATTTPWPQARARSSPASRVP